MLGLLLGLAVSINGQPATVVQRKLPSVDDVLDALPMLIFTPPEEPDSDEPFNTGGYRLYQFVYEVALVARGNRDLVTGLPDFRLARQQVSFLFGQPRPLNNPALLRIDLEPGQVIDRGKINANYDYSTMRLR